MICRNCGSHVPDNQFACDNCGTVTKIVRDVPASDKMTALPMRWFKVLIYFVLFATAALYIYEGVNIILGGQYSQPAAVVRAEFEGLTRIDIIFAVGSFVLAGIAIFARFALAAFRSEAIGALNIVYALNMALIMFYVVSILLVTNGEVLDVVTLFHIPFDLTMIAVNSAYFKKREKLFTN